jgi:putative membrane protein
MLKAELKYLRKNKFLLAALIVIALIPSIYAVTFLKSMWDPYGKTGELPVAVVNQDRSATMNGKQLTLGADLAANLKRSDSLDFRVVSAKTARAGIKSGRYYAVYTIPSDFSQNATMVFSAHPKQLRLHLTTSSGRNLFAGKIASTAATKIQDQINGQLNKAYTKTLVAGLSKVATGMTTAAKGAGQLADWSAQLTSGAQTLHQGTQTVSTGQTVLATSAKQLASGSQQYAAGVTSAAAGSTQLSSGLDELQGKLPALATGMKQLHSGTTQLAAGLSTAASGSESLASGAQKLNASLTTFNSSSAQLASKSTQFAKALQTFADELNKAQGSSQTAGLAQLLTAVQSSLQQLTTAQTQAIAATKTNVATAAAEMKLTAAQTAQLQTAATAGYAASLEKQEAALKPLLTELQTALTQLSGTSAQSGQLATALGQLTTGANQLAKGNTQLASAAGQLQAGSQQLTTGAQQLNAGNQQLLAGATQLNTSVGAALPQVTQLSSGVAQLSSGATTLNTGLATLSSKGQTLTSGSSQLAAGAQKLAAGSDQLVSGSAQLQSGSSSLQTGSTTLQQKLAAGAKALPQLHFTTQNAKMVAHPATVKSTERDDVPNNGSAMAPYMAGVALYVLAMAINMMFDTVTPRKTLKSATAWWASKTTIINGVAVLGATLEYGFLYLIAGLRPDLGVASWLVLVLTALVLMNMVTWLNLALDRLGAFVAMVLLVLQLSSSAGTYPIELSGGFFQAVHPYLPISYTVDALRHTIMMNSWPAADLLVLLGFFVGFSGLMWLNYKRRSLRFTEIEMPEEG